MEKNSFFDGPHQVFVLTFPDRRFQGVYETQEIAEANAKDLFNRYGWELTCVRHIVRKDKPEYVERAGQL